MPGYNEVTYLLDRLDKSVEHIRQVSQWVIGLVIAFATGLVMTESRNLVTTPSERAETALVMIAAVVVHAMVLRREMRHVFSFRDLICEAADDRLKDVLSRRRDLVELKKLIGMRVSLVAIILFVCWFAVADIDEVMGLSAIPSQPQERTLVFGALFALLGGDLVCFGSPTECY